MGTIFDAEYERNWVMVNEIEVEVEVDDVAAVRVATVALTVEVD